MGKRYPDRQRAAVLYLGTTTIPSSGHPQGLGLSQNLEPGWASTRQALSLTLDLHLPCSPALLWSHLPEPEQPQPPQPTSPTPTPCGCSGLPPAPQPQVGEVSSIPEAADATHSHGPGVLGPGALQPRGSSLNSTL